MSEQYKLLHPAKYYKDYLIHNIRPDGRKFDQVREMIGDVGSISTADGSALVRIGNTYVVCGIKAELCQPKPENPDEGFLIPNVELPPLCSSKFRPGPPSEQAQIATQLVADILRNSQCLDLKSLSIFPDKLAWCLYADLICLNYDGALIDACVIALITALRTTLLPEVFYDAALDNKQVNSTHRKPLQINSLPCSTTFVLFDDIIMIDPTNEEEELCTSSITIVVKEGELCFVHKPGGSRITDEQLFTCIEDSKERALIINDFVNTVLKTE